MAFNCLDVGSGYSPYKNWDTCDLNAYSTFYSLSDIADNSYDFIRVRNVIHHVKNLEHFILEIKRILTEKGRAVIIDCLENDYKINLIFDIIWYRYIVPRYEIYISPVYREINDGLQMIVGGKLWIRLNKI